MDDKYKSTLDKVVRLAEQNKEFGEELRKRLGVSSAILPSSDDRKISNIEKYLGLDYYIDTKPITTSFAFVSDNSVRTQLESDNREMMRYRYGTRNHKVDFGEFCRYALLQAEMLMNYYYSEKNDTLSDIKRHIKTYNKSASIDSSKSIGAISLAVKLWAFRAEYKTHRYYWNLAIFDNIREMRNEMSHRTPKSDGVEIVEYQRYLKGLQLPLKKDGEVNTYKLSEQEGQCKLFDNQIKNSNEYKRYCFLLWSQREPFDEIIERIDELTQMVKEVL